MNSTSETWALLTKPRLRLTNGTTHNNLLLSCFSGDRSQYKQSLEGTLCTRRMMTGLNPADYNEDLKSNVAKYITYLERFPVSTIERAIIQKPIRTENRKKSVISHTKHTLV
jgi:hypothetical protein